MFWRAFWGTVLPEKPEYRFLDHGDYLENPSGERLEELRRPAITSIMAMEAASYHMATLVRSTHRKWGLEVGMSIPGTMTAWFAVDDYSAGKFSSAGLVVYRGVAFGAPSVIKGDLEDVARVALTHGVPADNMEFITEMLASPFNFPLTKRVENLWGNILHLGDLPVLEALLQLQQLRGVSLKTALAATKTLEEIL